MRKLNIVFVLGAVGCGTDQSASGVFPANGFLGRTVHVEISGDATSWKDGATVDFGDGVTVGSVTVASPTALFADLTIAATAATGPHDVTVSSGGSVTLKQAFDIESPAELTITGSTAQGGFPQFSIVNHDFDTPFDPTQDPNTGAFTNLAISAPAGVDFRIGAATNYTITGFIAIDLDAVPGSVSIESGSSTQTAFAVGNLDVPATTPIALTPGTAATGMIAMPFDTQVFSIDAGSAMSLLRFAATTTSQDGVPIVNVLQSDGTWADALAGGATTATYLPAGGTFYAIVYDNGDAAGYSFSITGKTQSFTSFTETTDIGAATGTAVTGTLPYHLSATLASAADKDWIKIVTTAPAVIHIKTIGNDATTDTAIDLLDSDGLTSEFGGPIDNAYDEEAITSDIIGDPVQVPAGTYYVSISAGALFAVAHNGYAALVWTE